MAVVETRYGEGVLGSCHAIELPIVLGTVDKAEQLVGGGPDARAFGERIAAWDELY